ncbi:MAG: hypothetical protein AB7S72_20150 [Draconibacterium sp.]
MNKLLITLFNHERYQSISVIVAIAILIALFGCQPKCSSLLDPEKKITETELQGEIALLQSRADSAYLSIDQQKNLQAFLLNQAEVFAGGNVVNPLSVVMGIAGILGIGAATDNVRKRLEVRNLERIIESELKTET